MYKQTILWVTTLTTITCFHVAPAQALSIFWTGDDRITETNSPSSTQNNTQGYRQADSSYEYGLYDITLTADTKSSTNGFSSSLNTTPAESKSFIRVIRSFELSEGGSNSNNLKLNLSVTGTMSGSVGKTEVNNERPCKSTNKKSCYISNVKTKVYIADCKNLSCLEFMISGNDDQTLNGKTSENKSLRTPFYQSTIPELEFNKTYYLITELTATSQKVKNAKTSVNASLTAEFPQDQVIPEPSCVLGFLFGGVWLGFYKKRNLSNKNK